MTNRRCNRSFCNSFTISMRNKERNCAIYLVCAQYQERNNKQKRKKKKNGDVRQN